MNKQSYNFVFLKPEIYKIVGSDSNHKPTILTQKRNFTHQTDNSSVLGKFAKPIFDNGSFSLRFTQPEDPPSFTIYYNFVVLILFNYIFVGFCFL